MLYMYIYIERGTNLLSLEVIEIWLVSSLNQLLASLLDKNMVSVVLRWSDSI